MERRWFKDLKIGHKLLVTHLTIAFLSITLITVVSYVSVTFFLHRNVSDYNIQIINQLNSNIEKNLQYMDNLSLFISYHNDINRYLTGRGSSPRRLPLSKIYG